MSPKRSAASTLDEALRRVADKDVEGVKPKRVEAFIDEDTDTLLNLMGESLGGGKGRRSVALRALIRKGAQAALAERAERAPKV